MEGFDGSSSSQESYQYHCHDDDDDGECSDESAEIRSLVETYSKKNEEEKKKDENERRKSTVSNKTINSKGKKQNRNKKKGSLKYKPNSLDHLKQRVSQLMKTFEDHGLFIPPPEPVGSCSNSSGEKKKKKGKVWSNRNYGADKKRQRKQVEFAQLTDRIEQLEQCLQSEHGIVPP